MKSLRQKMGLSTKEFRDKLAMLYLGEQMSQSKIAELMGCHKSTIENYFYEFGIQCRNESERSQIKNEKHINLSKQEKEILDGLLLSDLHLEVGTFQARITFGVLYEEFARYIMNSLPNIKWSELYEYQPKNSPNVNYFGKSTFSIELFDLQKIWYDNKVKRIPESLVSISPTILHWWYLGDGYMCKHRNQLALCTDAFNMEDTKRISDVIHSTYDIPVKVDSRRRISIYGQHNIQKFLSIIGEPKIKCYEYKWGEVKL